VPNATRLSGARPAACCAGVAAYTLAQRDYVAQNRPCVITGVVAGWPAAARWADDAYLRAAMAGAPPIAVNVTPHGRGDAVLRCAEHGDRELFVLPHEARMPFAALLDALDESADAPEGSPAGVPYASAQNGSLGADFAPLLADLPASLDWAQEAFGAPPDAVNLWVGNGRSVTTFHHDHYENLYAVLVGEKRFTLLPPADAHRLRTRTCPVARFAPDAAAPGGWRAALEAPARRVAWARAEPGELGAPAAVSVTLRAGELLYLPALWHHHVAQAGRRVIAVNWWHDMPFDHRYANLQLVLGLTRALAEAEHDEAEADEA
jgi:jumonji domain-containing protein 7